MFRQSCIIIFHSYGDVRQQFQRGRKIDEIADVETTRANASESRSIRESSPRTPQVRRGGAVDMLPYTAVCSLAALLPSAFTQPPSSGAYATTIARASYTERDVGILTYDVGCRGCYLKFRVAMQTAKGQNLLPVFALQMAGGVLGCLMLAEV